jgi:hypothetical protein
MRSRRQQDPASQPPQARTPRKRPVITWDAQHQRGSVEERLSSGHTRRARAPVIQVHEVTKVYDLGQIKVRALREVSL